MERKETEVSVKRRLGVGVGACNIVHSNKANRKQPGVKLTARKARLALTASKLEKGLLAVSSTPAWLRLFSLVIACSQLLFVGMYNIVCSYPGPNPESALHSHPRNCKIFNVPHIADFHLVTGEYSQDSCFDAYQRALNNA